MSGLGSVTLSIHRSVINLFKTSKSLFGPPPSENMCVQIFKNIKLACEIYAKPFYYIYLGGRETEL